VGRRVRKRVDGPSERALSLAMNPAPQTAAVRARRCVVRVALCTSGLAQRRSTCTERSCPTSPSMSRPIATPTQRTGASELKRTGFNLAFVSMNWGFPPEVESRHWEEYGRAVRAFREAGSRWSATCRRRTVWPKAATPTAIGTCVRRAGGVSPTTVAADDLLEQPRVAVRSRVARPARPSMLEAQASSSTTAGWALRLGPWGGRVGGFAGCACSRCASAFREAHGQAIPATVGDDEISQTYLGWRAAIHAQRLGGWAEAIRRRTRTVWC